MNRFNKPSSSYWGRWFFNLKNAVSLVIVSLVVSLVSVNLVPGPVNLVPQPVNLVPPIKNQ